MRMKTKLIEALVLTVALLVSFQTTYAYLIDRDEVVNVFTIGETETEIEEEFEPPEKLEPGVTFTKSPKVKNTGNIPCFVRARVDFSTSDMKDLCNIDINTTYWEYNSTDGYYYYKELLEVGQATEYLFEEIEIKDSATQAQIKDFDVLVYAESIQHTDHAGDCPANEYYTVWQ